MLAQSGSGTPGTGTLMPLNGAVDPGSAGTKAATLARLAGKGFRVPEGYVVPPQLAREIATSGAPEAIRVELAKIATQPLAVRSSALAEDTELAAFAGQYETVLEVNGLGEVIDAIRTVWESGQALSVLDYRRQHGLDLDDGSDGIAILIQPMIDPETAGAAFSANPVTGDLDEVVINAVPGLGDRLMAGESDSETWIVRGSSATPNSEGTALSETAAGEIAELARQVQREFGEPQDIEWAISDGKLYLLQARPITALPVEPDLPPLPPGTWMKETEHISGVISVAMADLYIPVLERGSRAMFQECGALLESLRFIDRAGELYVQAVPVGDRQGPPPPGWLFGLLVRVIPSLRERSRQAEIALNRGGLDRTVALWYSEWRAHLQSRCRELLQVELGSLNDRELAVQVDLARELFSDGFEIHLQLTSPQILAAYELVRVADELFGWSDTDAMMLVANAAEASSAPGIALERLAEYVRSRPSTRELVERPSAGIDDIRRADPEFGGKLQAYLDEFGHRVLDNDVDSPTLFERPDLVLGLIAKQLGETERRERSSAHLEARERAEELLALRSEADRTRMRHAIERATELINLREDNILLTALFPASLIRYRLLEIADRLMHRRVIGQPDDVFYLTLDEAKSFLQDRDPSGAITVVRTRRAERAWTAAHPGPLLIGGVPTFPDTSWLPTAVRWIADASAWNFGKWTSPAREHRSDLVLTGLPSSAGRHRGPVRIVRDQRDFHRVLPGDVLVCPITTSAWGILFSTAGALVTDHGGVLSHPAIAAREHGVPAVIGTGEGTRRLQDGQIVIVDGSAGTVEFVEAG